MKVSNIAFTALTLMGVSSCSAFAPLGKDVRTSTFKTTTSIHVAANPQSESDQNQHESIQEMRSKMSVTRGADQKVRIDCFVTAFFSGKKHVNVYHVQNESMK